MSTNFQLYQQKIVCIKIKSILAGLVDYTIAPHLAEVI